MTLEVVGSNPEPNPASVSLFFALCRNRNADPAAALSCGHSEGHSKLEVMLTLDAFLPGCPDFARLIVLSAAELTRRSRGQVPTAHVGKLIGRSAKG